MIEKHVSTERGRKWLGSMKKGVVDIILNKKKRHQKIAVDYLPIKIYKCGKNKYFNIW